MANVSHASLTGSSLHEPKGVASAAANTVYAADGAGSGAWTDMNTLVTATNFTTGDAKLTFKTTADSGWVLMNDGTIGDALSSGTTRANADCEDLFTLFWNNISNTYAAVSGGRGANAAADWAAHKTIALPKELGRALVIAGAGSGLTSRTLGATAGAETHALTGAETGPHVHTGTTNNEATNHSHSATSSPHAHFTTNASVTVPSGNTSATAGATVTVANAVSTDLATAITTSTAASISVGAQDTLHNHAFTTNSSGSGTAHNNVQPSSFINIMVKL